MNHAPIYIETSSQSDFYIALILAKNNTLRVLHKNKEAFCNTFISILVISNQFAFCYLSNIEFI